MTTPSLCYLDAAARAAVLPEALAAGTRSELFAGNAGSVHRAGHQARQAWDHAMADIARALSCQVPELVITANATESIFLALLGIARGITDDSQPFDVISSAIEHPAVQSAVTATGGRPVFVAPDAHGTIPPEALRAALTPRTRLVSIQAANNIVGTIQPLRQLVQVVRTYEQAHGIRIAFHTDAAQLAPWQRVLPHELGVDALTLSGAKLGTPSGVGLLYLGTETNFQSPLPGGGQQDGRRGGSLPVRDAVELAAALRARWNALPTLAEETRRRRDQLRDAVLHALPDATVNGNPVALLPNFLSLTVPEIDAETAVYALDARSIAAAAGSACSSSKSTGRTAVLETLGLLPDAARATLRFSVDWSTSDDAIEYASRIVPQVLIDVLRQVATQRAIRAHGRALADSYAQDSSDAPSRP